MEADPRRNDYRKALRRREFGENPACTLCGEDDPIVFHHVAGEANDLHLDGPVCANCHLLCHEGMRHLGVDLRHQPKTILERLLAVLRGLAAFFRQLASRLAEWADKLAALISALDAKVPGWRDLEEAW
jgi:hypothetical protein